MVFILDNYFSTDRKKNCAILKSDKYTIEQVVELIGFITSIARDIRPIPFRPEAGSIGRVLENVYGFKDVKELYRSDMNFFERRIISKTMMVGFEICGEFVAWIDVQEANDMYGKRNHKEFLVDNKRYIDAIKEVIVSGNFQ